MGGANIWLGGVVNIKRNLSAVSWRRRRWWGRKEEEEVEGGGGEGGQHPKLRKGSWASR